MDAFLGLSFTGLFFVFFAILSCRARLPQDATFCAPCGAKVDETAGS